MTHTGLELQLQQAAFEQTLTRLYGPEGVERARSRCIEVTEGFHQTFDRPAQALFSAPGRTEIGGNHTDHQRGCVLAASVDLDILAAAAPTQSGVIRVLSQGYPMTEVDLRELTPRQDEVNTSAALIRGVAARMSEMGCDLRNRGLDVYMTSTVPKGSGLSSSAAYEVLIGTMLNELFWAGHCTPVELAQIGQYAENVFFGKPCGLMDQTASSVGGVVAIDFADTAHPAVERLDVDLHAYGYALCILDSGAGHEDLTGEYSAITEELRAVCRVFGKEVLREVPEEDFLAELPKVRKTAGDRAVNRAFHVYGENRRAQAEKEALRQGDFDRFLTLVRESGRSSAMYLQNIIPTGSVTAQELMVTIALCERILEGRGAVRVHGGGFGGTAQAFVPLDMLEKFKAATEAALGPGCCHVVMIRPAGGIKLG
ncbi:MAG: galactokinase [Clostridiales bacterium]|nr:galactokinase [Clostridiales bacterium]